jgi:hypothetical protein
MPEASKFEERRESKLAAQAENSGSAGRSVYQRNVDEVDIKVYILWC